MFRILKIRSKNPSHLRCIGAYLFEVRTRTLNSIATFILSISAGSAGTEREFSSMGYMLSPRRSSYTASNTNKRLTLSNLLPQKRRFESDLAEKKVKKTKLFDNK